ncbi:pentapeptide repeat-containing protein [Nocardia brasiliensis]|uniref:pentapeptide repeat-containing protein n=1 Tax=Nocardia brasiliensis TaxID=37326 RepID=UPI00245839A0|nr:pentapeptide repeat-containing protein [Nocardia brasiliensis]
MIGWDGWLKLGAVVAAAGVLGGLWFTAGTLVVTNKQYGITERTEVTNRFAQAVTQLGNESMDVRLGAIYQLERLTIDSPRDRSVIFETISAYIRTHAARTPDCRPEQVQEASQKKPPEDVQSALTVIGRRDSSGSERINLSRTCLVGANLHYANLAGLQVDDADLSFADLSNSVLRNGWFHRSSLDHAALSGTDLTGIRSVKTSFVSANFLQANLSWAEFYNANFDNADFSGAYLSKTLFSCARLNGAAFAFSINLSLAHFESIQDSYQTRWPVEFIVPKNSDFLCS